MINDDKEFFEVYDLPFTSSEFPNETSVATIIFQQGPNEEGLQPNHVMCLVCEKVDITEDDGDGGEGNDRILSLLGFGNAFNTSAINPPDHYQLRASALYEAMKGIPDFGEAMEQLMYNFREAYDQVQKEGGYPPPVPEPAGKMVGLCRGAPVYENHPDYKNGRCSDCEFFESLGG